MYNACSCFVLCNRPYPTKLAFVSSRQLASSFCPIAVQIVQMALILACVGMLVLSVAADDQIVLKVSNESVEVAPEYRSFTADWWRHNQPHNGPRWEHAGMLTLDLTNTRLRNLVKALSPAIWRIGGSPEDSVVYVVGNPPECNTTEKIKDSYNYPGPICLTMERWGEILDFVNYTGVKLAFGLNGLYQRHHHDMNFNSTNAKSFLSYTASKFPSAVYAFELSNEDNSGQADADKLAEDYGTIRKYLDDYWVSQHNRPLLFGPDIGYHGHGWFQTFIKMAGPLLNRTTVHSYCNTYSDIVCLNGTIDMAHLRECPDAEASFKAAVKSTYPGLDVMAGETGPRSGGGVDGCTNTFANSFWYLQMLGSLAQMRVLAFARSTMVGGYYEMINKTMFSPNPDYFVALLWGRYMGSVHINTSIGSDDPDNTAINGFASCRSLATSGNDGITVLLYNADSSKPQTVTIDGLKFNEVSDAGIAAVETHIRAHDGTSLYSREVEMLQSTGEWKLLEVGEDGIPPNFAGIEVQKLSPVKISLNPLSYSFVHFPTAVCPSG